MLVDLDIVRAGINANGFGKGQFIGVGIGLYSPKVVHSSKLWYRYPAYPPVSPNNNPADPGNPVMREQ